MLYLFLPRESQIYSPFSNQHIREFRIGSHVWREVQAIIKSFRLAHVAFYSPGCITSNGLPGLEGYTSSWAVSSQYRPLGNRSESSKASHLQSSHAKISPTLMIASLLLVPNDLRICQHFSPDRNPQEMTVRSLGTSLQSLPKCLVPDNTWEKPKSSGQEALETEPTFSRRRFCSR